jgi:hypothetical protein
MKYRTTKKYVMANAGKVFALGYCEAQSLLRDIEPEAYTCGVYGWNCDIYNLGDGVIITTGYRPFGKNVDHKKLLDFEKKSESLNEWDDKSKAKRARLLVAWVMSLEREGK